MFVMLHCIYLKCKIKIIQAQHARSFNKAKSY